MAGSGLMQIVNGELVRLGPKLPEGMPAPAVWTAGSGLLLLLLGVMIVSGRFLRWAGLVLAAIFAVLFCLKSVPEILSNPGAGFMWTNPAKILALLGGGWFVAAIGSGCATPAEQRKAALVAPVLLGVFLVICGTQHFVYAGFVDGLVPAWMPPGQRFWTYFSAVALLAGGIGVALPPARRWAGLLAGIMILLWVPLVHLARTWELRNAFELAGCFEALALGGAAWLMSESGQTTAVSRI